MSTSSQEDLFSNICLRVSNKLYYEELISKQHTVFDIQPYKIQKLYSEAAKKIYKLTWQKYLNTHEEQLSPQLWYENQRKIFIWFMVCFLHQMQTHDPLDPQIDWAKLSSIFYHKSQAFLKFQLLNIVKIKGRVNWNTQEDELLSRATQEAGPGRWNQISKAIYFESQCAIFKTPKHCRQRWLNHLDGNKFKGKWSDEEDFLICRYVQEYGKKWSKISVELKGTRTEHMVKNRFNSLLTKNRKNKKNKDNEILERMVYGLEKKLRQSGVKPMIQQEGHGNELQEHCEIKAEKNVSIIHQKQSSESLHSLFDPHDSQNNKQKKQCPKLNHQKPSFAHSISSQLLKLRQKATSDDFEEEPLNLEKEKVAVSHEMKEMHQHSELQPPQPSQGFMPHYSPMVSCPLMMTPEMMYFCPLPFYQGPKDQNQQENNQCPVEYKTKPVYIIQKNY